MKIQILKVENPIPIAEDSFNAHGHHIGCNPKWGMVDGKPEINLYEVFNKELFFLGVVKYGIEYKEVDYHLQDFKTEK